MHPISLLTTCCLASLASAQISSAMGPQRFSPDGILVLRGGVGGATALSSKAQPAQLVEYSPSGTLLQTLPLPSATTGPTSLPLRRAIHHERAR